MKIYLVGGAVRDQLLGRPVHEHDYVVVGATPEQLLSQGYKAVGKDFPVFLHPKTRDEYALARTERKVGRGYTQFECHFAPDVTLEQDLLRRDLTINAIAADEQGNLVDPYGGQQDLQNKILRHISPSFKEDPVRMLRLGRFLARYAHLGFTVAPETEILLREMVRAGEVDALVPERVWKEWQGALSEPSPGEFIKLLRRVGALKILVPELDNLFGVPNPPQWHAEIDSGVHTLMVLEEATKLSTEPVVRFAALLHDLGKGVTAHALWPSHKMHEITGVPLIKAVCERFKVPKDYQNLAELVSEYHLHVHKVPEMKDGTIVRLLENLDAYRRPERFQHFLLACEADFRGRPLYQNQTYHQKDLLWQAYQLTKKVEVENMDNLTGSAIKNQIHMARVKKLANLPRA